MLGEKSVDYKYSVRKQESFRMKDLCTHFRKLEKEKEIKYKIYNRKEMEIERQWKSTECTQMEKSMKLKGNSLKKMINKIDKPKTILTKETKRK